MQNATIVGRKVTSVRIALTTSQKSSQVKSKCLSRDPALVLTNPMGFLKVATIFLRILRQKLSGWLPSTPCLGTPSADENQANATDDKDNENANEDMCSIHSLVGSLKE